MSPKGASKSSLTCPTAHPTQQLPYYTRASLPSTSSLAAYLLRLIAIKRTNLCLSADVDTTSQLLELADECGDSICMLKTHADIISDFGERTVTGLKEIARRKKFLIFEDRKFGDIGSTVQKQYTLGPFQIVRWAALTNAHIFPGPAIITALKAAANSSLAALNSVVSTEITAGHPHYPEETDNGSSNFPPPVTNGSRSSQPTSSASSPTDEAYKPLRKPSIVSVSTTITTRTEPIHPPVTFTDADFFPHHTSGNPPPGSGVAASLAKLGDPPSDRGLLLLAEMSSEGNLLSGPYTQKCVEMARQHADFVIGFIAQRALNEESEDNFITFTPGVSLPPPGMGEKERGKMMGDALGQVYRTPRSVVLGDGCDVVIVGRGVLNAEDRREEAERYRREAWVAYEERIGRGR